MSRKLRVQKAERSTQALVPVTPPQATTPADVEPDQLARELVRAFSQKLDEYRRRQGLGAEQPDPTERPPDWFVEGILAKPPEDVHFGDLHRLTQIDPFLATARWQEVKCAARRDLESGWAAGRALEPHGGNAWDRALFLAVRERLFQAWRPRHAGEVMLVEEMAQYESLRQRWLAVLSMHTHEPTTMARRHDRSHDEPRRLTAAQSTEEAMRMVERLQRLAHQALRSLLNLRRGRGAFIVHGSGPLNVAVGQQLNVNASVGASTAPSEQSAQSEPVPHECKPEQEQGATP